MACIPIPMWRTSSTAPNASALSSASSSNDDGGVGVGGEAMDDDAAAEPILPFLTARENLRHVAPAAHREISKERSEFWNGFFDKVQSQQMVSH